jgi:hypothetical protein
MTNEIMALVGRSQGVYLAFCRIATTHAYICFIFESGRVHRLPTVPQLPDFAMGAVEIAPFLKDIAGSPLEQHPFVRYCGRYHSSTLYVLNTRGYCTVNCAMRWFDMHR